MSNGAWTAFTKELTTLAKNIPTYKGRVPAQMYVGEKGAPEIEAFMAAALKLHAGLNSYAKSQDFETLFK